MAVTRSSKKNFPTVSKTKASAEVSRSINPEINDIISKQRGQRVPATPPPFTLADIKNAIPEHCFHRSLLKSCTYLAADLALLAAFVYFAVNINNIITESTFGNMTTIVRGLAWIMYWLCAGHVGTGLWVIGHECGHHGFTGIEWLNDVFGFVIHSLLMVPYFSWQISHRKHHSNTGNIDRDEVHVPVRWDSSLSKKDQQKIKDHDDHDFEYFALVRSSFLKRIRNVFVMLVLGWPFYLIKNASGHLNYPKNRSVNHFTPSSPIYLPKEGKLVVLSDMGVLSAIFVLWCCGKVYTHSLVAMLYVVPYLIVNLYLVMITYLQHTDITLAHYDNKEWNWLRGAMLTIDRSYGWLLDIVFHHIADTHVTHHLFSYLPHYHAQEATVHIKKVLGDYYSSDFDNSVWKVLWDNHTMSPFVMKESEGEEFIDESDKRSNVYWYYPHEAYLKQKVV